MRVYNASKRQRCEICRQHDQHQNPTRHQTILVAVPLYHRCIALIVRMVRCRPLHSTLQAENARLRDSVTSLRTALHRTIDFLEQAKSEAPNRGVSLSCSRKSWSSVRRLREWEGHL